MPSGSGAFPDGDTTHNLLEDFYRKVASEFLKTLGEIESVSPTRKHKSPDFLVKDENGKYFILAELKAPNVDKAFDAYYYQGDANGLNKFQDPCRVVVWFDRNMKKAKEQIETYIQTMPSINAKLYKALIAVWEEPWYSYIENRIGIIGRQMQMLMKKYGIDLVVVLPIPVLSPEDEIPNPEIRSATIFININQKQDAKLILRTLSLKGTAYITYFVYR